MAKVNEATLMGEFQAVAHPGIVVEVVVCVPDCPHTQIMVSPHKALVAAGEKAEAPTVMGMMAAFVKNAEHNRTRIVWIFFMVLGV